MGKNQHVTYRDDKKWNLIGEGNSRATAIFDTQKEAIEAGKNMAKRQQSELLIHGRNNKIRARNSYGNDPYPPKG